MTPVLHRWSGRWPAALLASLVACLGNAPVWAQTRFDSNVNALGGYLPSGSDDFVYDGGVVSLSGATPLGLVRQIADPNPGMLPYNGYAEGWSKVDVAGVHVYA